MKRAGVGTVRALRTIKSGNWCSGEPRHMWGALAREAWEGL